jgi:anti-sigma factor RsiW
MQCRQVQFYLSDYLSGNLSLRDTQEFAEHLASCSTCRQLVQEEKNLVRMLRGSPIPDPGESYWNNLDREIPAKALAGTDQGNAAAEYSLKSHARFPWRLAVPLAAGIFLFFLSLQNDIPLNRLVNLDKWAAGEIAVPDKSDATEQFFSGSTEYIDSDSEMEYTLLLSAPGLAGRNLLVMEIILGAERGAPQ